jgi:hypothetical protein
MTTEINKLWPGIHLNVTSNGVLGPDSSKPDPDYINNNILMDPAGIKYFNHNGSIINMSKFMEGIGGLSEAIYTYLNDNGEVLPEKPADFKDLFYHNYKANTKHNYDIKIIHLFSPNFKGNDYKSNEDYSTLKKEEIIEILGELYFKLFDEYLKIVKKNFNIPFVTKPILSFCPISGGNYKPEKFHSSEFTIPAIDIGFKEFLKNKDEADKQIINQLKFNLCINADPEFYVKELDILLQQELKPRTESVTEAKPETRTESKPETAQEPASGQGTGPEPESKPPLEQVRGQGQRPETELESQNNINSAILLVASTLYNPEITPPVKPSLVKPPQVKSPIVELKPQDNPVIKLPIVASPKTEIPVSSKDISQQLKLLDTIEDKNIPEAENIFGSIRQDIINMKEKISRIIVVIKKPNVVIITSNLENLIININIIIRLANKLNIEITKEFIKEEGETSLETFEKLNTTLNNLLSKVDLSKTLLHSKLDVKPESESKVEVVGVPETK